MSEVPQYLGFKGTYGDKVPHHRLDRREHQQDDAPCQREFFVDNLLVRIHLIIEIILVDRPCAMGV